MWRSASYFETNRAAVNVFKLWCSFLFKIIISVKNESNGPHNQTAEVHGVYATSKISISFRSRSESVISDTEKHR